MSRVSLPGGETESSELRSGFEQFLRETLHLPDGQIGIVTAIHTFGDYLKNFHPHLHAVVADGLFTSSGSFYVMPDVDIKPLEESSAPL